MTDDRPILSIVLTGRNDGYGTDFLSRCTRTIAFNHRQLTDFGVSHEFVFVEWNPVPARPWVCDIIRDELPELNGIFRAYVVDPAYNDAFTLNPRLAFLEFPAKNIGIRRARGTFVLASNCDVYLGRAVVDAIARGDLRRQVVYRALRVDIRVGTDQGAVDWSMLEDPRNYERRPMPLAPPLYAGGTGDFLLLDRESYYALGGFNEVYRVARIGVDQNFLVKAYSNRFVIADIGGSVYHVNHTGSFRTTWRQYEGREHEAPWGDSRWAFDRITYTNPDSWGLAVAPERDLAHGRTWVGFDWAAVPPLVDLKRVVAAPSWPRDLPPDPNRRPAAAPAPAAE